MDQLEQSDDEEQDFLDIAASRSSPGPPPFVAMNGGAAVRTSQAPMAPGGVSPLGLHFSGGAAGASSTSSGSAGGGVGMMMLSWRDGRFSDWPVQVEDKTYRLHAFILARASMFFEKHMDMATRKEAEGGPLSKRGSDLTDVLPHSCHSAFEDALDFIYSANQAGFEAQASKALLLLKIADILQIEGLFCAMGRRIEASFAEMAPLLLEQYCRFHIPGTDDGAALRQIRDGAVDLIVRKFQPFLANPEMRTALLRLPAQVLAEVLEEENLLVDSEDAVYDFVAGRLQVARESDEGASASCSMAGGLGSDAASAGSQALAADKAEGMECTEDDRADLLWHRVRWAHLSAGKFAQALAPGYRLLSPELALHALTERVARLDLGGVEAFAPLRPQPAPTPARRPILPPGVPAPTSTEIDFCFHFSRAEQYTCGDALRSQPKRIGDVVLRVLVFPAGTDTGVARGSLSVFLEAVPQAHWPRDWEFANIRYAISCIRWPTGSGETWAAKRKSDLWTFKANRLDRGWHDFLAPGEIHRYLGPDGFVCLRGQLEPECLARTFLLSSQAGSGSYPGPNGEAAASSASRRSWAPRTSGLPAGPE